MRKIFRASDQGGGPRTHGLSDAILAMRTLKNLGNVRVGGRPLPLIDFRLPNGVHLGDAVWRRGMSLDDQGYA